MGFAGSSGVAVRGNAVEAKRRSTSGRRPNVVLINCDDLGWGDLACYGSELNSTPAIDRLASEGIRLTDFYAASPVCSPSRAALLTGCYPARIGFGEFDGLPVLFPGHAMGLDPNEATIARLLHDAGYATALFGKWHCGDQPEFLPTRHGFDEYFGLPYSNDMGHQAWFADLPPYVEFLRSLGVSLSIDEMPPLPLLSDEEVTEMQPDQADLTERYVEKSLDFIRRHPDAPFFLYLSHMYVHVPIYVQEHFAEASRNGRYGAAVESIDWATEVILAELEQFGLTEDTIVIFTSDNGSRAQGEGGSNGPLRAFKGTTWEGGQRVPCIVKWPGRIAPGTVSGALTCAIDLHPTLIEWCGVDRGERIIDGHDLSDVLLAPDTAPDAEASGSASGGDAVSSSETVTGGPNSPHEAIWFYSGNTLEAVRAGRWKLHVSRSGAAICELYDLLDDVGETLDVAANEPDVVARLQGLADAARAELGDDQLGITGAGTRPPGRVEHPTPLKGAPDVPWVIAEYDLVDRG